MIDPIQLYDQVRTEAITNNGLVLDASGEVAMKQIFDATLGEYPDYAVFDDAQVRKFINGQIRRIVVSARREAGSGPIGGELLMRHSHRVMFRTRQAIDELMDLSDVELSIGPKRMAVSFCMKFLHRHDLHVNANPSQTP